MTIQAPSTSRSVSAAVDSGLRNQPAPDIFAPSLAEFAG
jgi:hypothetical protein